MGKRFNSLSAYFQNQYGKKIVKLSLEGDFTCPNRDGTLDVRGCTFCSSGGSGEYAGATEHNEKATIAEQIESQKALLSKKWHDVSYLAYFQSYSNTYGSIEKMRALYDEVYAVDGIEGICIATRPDCVTEDMIPLFKTLKDKGIFWIELGLQSIHEKSIEWMRRHYSNAVFNRTFEWLKAAELPVVIHLIVGLPGETLEDFLTTIKHVNRLKPFGVKFHMLNALKGTDMAHMDLRFLLTESEYIDWVTHAIGWLDPEIVIHRDRKSVV